MKFRLLLLVGSLAMASGSHAATGFVNGLYFITSLNGGGNVYNQVRTGTTPGTGAASGHNLSPDGVNPQFPFQHIGILSLEFHVDKLSRPLL